MNSVAYLDNNATTIIRPEVIEAMSACLAAGYANPASQHAEGRRARKVLEEAREGIGRILGARQDSVQADRIVFTSGGTEANNLALAGRFPTGHSGLSDSLSENPKPARLIVSNIEHPSVIETARRLKATGVDVQWLPVNADGVVQLDRLPTLLNDETSLVAVMMANNETGVIQPIEQVVQACEDRAAVHIDAVQVAGKLPLSFRELGVASMTVTAHKFHGPRGIGALFVRYDQQIEPLTVGGSQQLGTRPGTESVALAVGMHKALELWQQDATENAERMTTLRDEMESNLREALPDIVINGCNSRRLPHTSNVSFPGLDRQAMLLALDRANVACSTGSACTSGSSEPSHVLIAMGAPKAVIEGSLRISLSPQSTPEEVGFATGKIVEIARKMKAFQGDSLGGS